MSETFEAGSAAAQEAVQAPQWTPLQEAYIQKLMATYQANLHFFHQRFPEVFEKLMAVPLPAPFEVGPDGELTLYYGRFKGGPRDFVDLGRMIYRHFDSPETRPRIRVTTDFLDKPQLAAPHRDMPYFYRHVEPRFRLELIEKFRALTAGEGQRGDASEFGERCLPIAIVFGSGYGWHLERLVDDWDLRHLAIVDTDLERLNLSLYFVDYVSLHQRFAKRGFYFTVAYDDNPERLANDLRNMFYQLWPPYFIQGAGMFFNDYDSERVHRLWDQLKADLWTFYRGWGFLDDEIVGIKQALENALSRYPLYTRKPQLPEGVVAFVVGNGPSLDGLLPLLREYADRAVVFSCGTSITALARAGIKPDFHVEVERTATTYTMLCEPMAREFVRDVPIVALSIDHPDVFTLTERPLMFLKDLDIGSRLTDFFGRFQRFRSNPTCTNGGADLALRMGFKQVFLFGVDYGYRPGGPHHSTLSVYFDDQTEQEEGVQQLVAATHRSLSGGREIAGNFGGTVLSSDNFIHSRDALALSVREFSSAQVYNLNDGAEIAGTIALRHEAFVPLNTSPALKQEAVSQALAAFTTDYDPDPFERLDYLVTQLRAVREDLTRLFEREFSNRMEACDLLFDMHHYLWDPRHQAAQVFPLVRGSMLHMGRFFYDCLTHMRDEAAAVEYGRFAFDLFLRFIDAAIDNLVSLHDTARPVAEAAKGVSA